MFSVFSAVFFFGLLGLFSACLAVHYFVAYLVLGSLISKPDNGCVSVCCNDLLIPLPLLTKQQREIAKLCVKRALQWPNFKISFSRCLTHSVCDISWQWQTNWMNKGSREVRTLYIKSFSDVVLNWRGCRCCLDVERPSAPSTICLFGCLACVWSLVVIVCAAWHRCLFIQVWKCIKTWQDCL